MPVSDSPWWWSDERVEGDTCVCPIQSQSEPTVFPEIAAKRTMPPDWAVSAESVLPPTR